MAQSFLSVYVGSRKRRFLFLVRSFIQLNFATFSHAKKYRHSTGKVPFYEFYLNIFFQTKRNTYYAQVRHKQYAKSCYTTLSTFTASHASTAVYCAVYVRRDEKNIWDDSALRLWQSSSCGTSVTSLLLLYLLGARVCVCVCVCVCIFSSQKYAVCE